MQTTRIKAIVDLADVDTIDDADHCVRCGRKVTSQIYLGLITVAEDSEKFGHSDASRACDNCARSFVRWFLEGAVGQIIENMPQELQDEYSRLMGMTQ